MPVVVKRRSRFSGPKRSVDPSVGAPRNAGFSCQINTLVVTKNQYNHKISQATKNWHKMHQTTCYDPPELTFYPLTLFDLAPKYNE